MKRIAMVFILAVLWFIVVSVFLYNHTPTASAQIQGTSSTSPDFSWVKTWGGGNVQAGRMAVDGSGNLYVVGYFSGSVDFDPDPAKTDVHTSANGSIDAYLSKFDANGNFLWAKTWGGGSSSSLVYRDIAYGVGTDSAGNVYVVGAYRHTVDFNPDPALTDTHTSHTNDENNIYLSKFAPDGTFQWVRTWGPDTGGALTGFQFIGRERE